MNMPSRFAILVFLLLACSCSVWAEEPRTGTMSGRFMIADDKPFADGKVFFYNTDNGPPPAPESYWRKTDHLAGLNQSGAFKTDLPEGRYYVSAVKRNGSMNDCHITKGDVFIISLDEKGSPKKYTVTNNKWLDIGTIIGAREIKTPSSDDRITGFEGFILDSSENPIEGAEIFVCISSSCNDKHIFAAEPSSKDGKFSIQVHKGGEYYLRVVGGRSHSGTKAIASKGTINYPASVTTGTISRGHLIRIGHTDQNS